MAFCFCFMLGAALSSAFDFSAWSFRLYVLVFPICLGIILVWNTKKYRFLLVCLLFFLLGILRVLKTVPGTTPNNLNYFWGQTVTMTGWISDEPDKRIDKTYYIFTAETLATDNQSRPINGTLLLKNRSYPEYDYSDQVKVTCDLEQPLSETDGNFRYDKYLATKGVFSVCTSASIEMIKPAGHRSVKSFFLRPIFRFKNTVNTQLSHLWVEPENSLLAGLLYGGKSGLPFDLSDNFSKTGVSHIVAVSGFNITIIVTTLVSLGITLGLYRRQASRIAALMIVLFVLFTGLSASVVRAASMGLLALLAAELGRTSRIAPVLVSTAAFMTAVNPYILVWDAGFQLSFLATAGLVYISPLLKEWGHANRWVALLNKWEWVEETLYATMSASIATLPLILYQFGRLSIVAPAVNLLILWLIPWLMLAGFVTLIISFFYFPIGSLFAFFTHLGLQYVILIVTWFGSQSWSAVEVQVPGWGMAAGYLALGYIIFKKKQDTKNFSP